MIRKYLILIICLLFVLSITGCPDVTKEKDEESTFTLSGDLIGEFATDTPTHSVTVQLLQTSSIDSTVLYTATVNTWSSTKISITFIRYADYSISGISAGTYYIYAKFNDANAYCDATDGPTEIIISSDVSGHDINFTD